MPTEPAGAVPGICLRIRQNLCYSRRLQSVNIFFDRLCKLTSDGVATFALQELIALFDTQRETSLKSRRAEVLSGVRTEVCHSAPAPMVTS